MAFEALLKNKLYLSQAEVKTQPIVDFLRLPFLSREPSVSKIRPTPSIHPSIHPIPSHPIPSIHAFDYQEIFQSLIDDSVDFCVDYLDEKPYDWAENLTMWGKDKKVLSEVVNKALFLIVECEDGDSELMEYQKKMVHVLARCFPLNKLELKLRANNEFTTNKNNTIGPK